MVAYLREKNFPARLDILAESVLFIVKSGKKSKTIFCHSLLTFIFTPLLLRQSQSPHQHPSVNLEISIVVRAGYSCTKILSIDFIECREIRHIL